MFKRSESYYIKKRKKLRKKIRNLPTASTSGSNYWTRRAKLERKYEKLGRKWWDVHQKAQFEGEEFGLDITDLPISLDDIRLSAWNLDPQTQRQKVEGSSEWAALRVLEDKSVKVEIWNTKWIVDGEEMELILPVRDGIVDVGRWASEADQRVLQEMYESRND
jgi:hypothetical protein